MSDDRIKPPGPLTVRALTGVVVDRTPAPQVAAFSARLAATRPQPRGVGSGMADSSSIGASVIATAVDEAAARNGTAAAASAAASAGQAPDPVVQAVAQLGRADDAGVASGNVGAIEQAMARQHYETYALLQLQIQMSSPKISTISNVLKTRHDTVKNTVANLR